MVEYKSAQGRERDSSLLGSMRGGTRNVLAGQLVSQLVSLSALAALYRLLKPGESELLTFNVPGKPGKYEFVCTFPGHWRTMYGVFNVNPG